MARPEIGQSLINRRQRHVLPTQLLPRHAVRTAQQVPRVRWTCAYPSLYGVSIQSQSQTPMLILVAQLEQLLTLPILTSLQLSKLVRRTFHLRFRLQIHLQICPPLAQPSAFVD